MGTCKSFPCLHNETIESGFYTSADAFPLKLTPTQSTSGRKSSDSPQRNLDLAKTSPILKIHRANFVHISQGRITDFYHMQEPLGNGSFGRVYKALHISTGIYRAVKAISKRHLDADDQALLLKEVEILKSLDHPNILKIFEVIEDNNTFYIITELCTGGEIFDKIVSQGHVSENNAAWYMYQVLSALSCCYKNGIVHRDLKPENLLLRDKESDSPLKLIDFGTSRRFKANRKLKSVIGTAYYIAPEVIEGRYDSKCDIWSSGVILYTMLCGNPPFNGTSDKEIMTKISRGVFTFSNQEWTYVSKEAKYLIKKMLTKNPETRPNAEELLKDPWIIERARNKIEDNIINGNTLSNLRSWKANYKLQQAVLAYIASQLITEEETEEIRKAFIAIDENGDGKLSAEELKQGFEKASIGKDINVEEILANCDTDYNGYIDYNEFLTATLDWHKALSDDRLQATFNAIDTDKSGTLSVSEIKNFLGGDQQIENTVWEKIIKDADTNGDGVIDFNEFKAAMMKHIV
ncbi:unnamed protein product [Blepharisma stoltei]|uniref:Calcium-dependent protein kinase 1 n=1 Tax=Blepharisma stoltei TaxID=1481888 RepID=A0AAU9K7B7_9CILI|nr:unnamed protein product [Blepharisma stoltei]